MGAHMPRKGKDEMTRTITIVCHERGCFDVQEGEKVCDGLAWDEMLGTIAELTHPKIGSGRYWMVGGDDLVERMQRDAARIARSGA
jgi:hypothetical protein